MYTHISLYIYMHTHLFHAHATKWSRNHNIKSCQGLAPAIVTMCWILAKQFVGVAPWQNDVKIENIKNWEGLAPATESLMST